MDYNNRHELDVSEAECLIHIMSQYELMIEAKIAAMEAEGNMKLNHIIQKKQWYHKQLSICEKIRKQCREILFKELNKFL